MDPFPSFWSLTSHIEDTKTWIGIISRELYGSRIWPRSRIWPTRTQSPEPWAMFSVLCFIISWFNNFQCLRRCQKMMMLPASLTKLTNLLPLIFKKKLYVTRIRYDWMRIWKRDKIRALKGSNFILNLLCNERQRNRKVTCIKYGTFDSMCQLKNKKERYSPFKKHISPFLSKRFCVLYREGLTKNKDTDT